MKSSSPIRPLVRLSARPSVRSSVCPLVRLAVCLFVCNLHFLREARNWMAYLVEKDSHNFYAILYKGGFILQLAAFVKLNRLSMYAENHINVCVQFLLNLRFLSLLKKACIRKC